MKTRQILSLLLISISILIAACSDRTNENFSISGQVKNAPNDSVVLVQEEDINRKKNKAIGKIPIDKDGKFKTDIKLEPGIYNLIFDDDKKLTLAIDKDQKLKIEGDVNDLSAVKIDGSEDTEKLLAYEKFRKESLARLVYPVREEIKKLQEEGNSEISSKIDQLGKTEIDNYDKHKDELIEFVKDKMGTSIAVYGTSLRWDGEKNLPFLDSLAKSFAEKHPDSDISKKLTEKVEVLKNTSIGGKVSDINLPNETGENKSLFPLKGKYTLIDFWASWCSPCRRESKTLAELYDRYHDQGFEIYGVSLDEDKNLWLNAIKKDQRIWTNVSTLEGFETPITFDYAVTSLPAKFIVDEQGKIVAKNLHGKELKEKIESLFEKQSRKNSFK